MTVSQKLCALVLSSTALIATRGMAAAAAPTQTPVEQFLSDLCWSVAEAGDPDTTDSGSDYASTCQTDAGAKIDHGVGAKTVVDNLCKNARNYSADLNELLDDSQSEAQTQALEAKHVKDCFTAAKKFAAQDGVTL